MSELVFGLHNKNRFILFLILTLLFIIGCAFFVFFTNNEQEVDDSADVLEQIEEDLAGNISQVSNSEKIEVGNRLITLGSGWKINTVIQDSDIIGYKCEDSCEIYEVVKDDLKFFISTPAAVKSENPPFTNEVFVSMNFGNSTIDLIYKELVFDETESEDSFFHEVYGCYEEICVSSGVLPLETESNVRMMDSFENFISTLIVN